MMQLTIERQRRGWSKSELARRTGIGLTEICRIEAGKIYVYPGWRRRIAEAFDLPEEELFQEVKQGA